MVVAIKGDVFINLIANAEKYCKVKHPVLKIDVFILGDVVCIDFVDNGAGVPIEKRKVIFEKFSRVTPERAGGSGLGLAISREIMLRLGGDITYVAGNIGARFRVMLPLPPPKDLN